MKYIVAMLIIFLILTNVFWLYQTFDKGVSINHSRSAQMQTERTVDTLLLLNNLLTLGQSYANVLRKLESDINSRLIKKTPNAIFLDSIVLIFDDGSLSSVKLLNDLSSEEYDALERR